MAQIAKEAGARLIVDNVFATPLYQSPFQLGADVVVYSATKHIDGQGRCLGGVILSDEEWINDEVMPFIKHTGPHMSPFSAWVLLKGLETLPLRVARQTETAGRIADYLASQSKVARLIYPGRDDHPQADVAKRQMSGGSTMLAMEIEGGKEAAFRFTNALEIVKISNNLGDAKSLITHPATTTHQSIGEEARAELGITDGILRLSNRSGGSAGSAGRYREGAPGDLTACLPQRLHANEHPGAGGHDAYRGKTVGKRRKPGGNQGHQQE